MNARKLSGKAQLIAAILNACFLACFSIPIASAATFDVPPGNVPALIAAINAANADGVSDTINLKGGVYKLTKVDNDNDPTGGDPNGLPRITTSITINGNGSTIAASGTLRILEVALDGTLFLTHVVIQNGNTDAGGAGVHNDGRLVIANSTFRGNRGGEGGAILNDGTAVIWQSAFVANAAGSDDSGGAVRNDGSMSIVNSTFTRNTAVDNGGAIRSDGPITISSSTFVRNTASFGGGAIQGSNSGRISTIKNVIFSGNGPQNCVGVTVMQGDNLDTDGTCGGTVVTADYLRLGSLARNGGDTPTHALRPHSVAIDAVADCTTTDGLPVTIDQRGVERPRRATCDVGAYEAETFGSAADLGVVER